MANLRGRVEVMGVPQTGVELLAVAGKQVLAVAHTDREGTYRFEGVAADRVVARFAEPFLGVCHRTVPAGAGDAIGVDFALQRADLVRLFIAIAPAEGVPFDWVDVKLTPRLPDLPPVVVLAAGTTSSLHESLWSRRITEPKLEVRVLRGRWDLRAIHFVDGPLRANPPPSLTASRVELPDGSAAPEELGGFLIDVSSDTEVRAQLRTLRPEEL